MEFKWVIDTKALQEYLESKLDRPSPEAIRKYFKGFNKMSQEHMFKEEIADVERLYQGALKEMQDKADDQIPHIVHHMRKFIEAYDSILGIQEKIEALDAKLGRDSCSSCGQEE